MHDGWATGKGAGTSLSAPPISLPGPCPAQHGLKSGAGCAGWGGRLESTRLVVGVHEDRVLLVLIQQKHLPAGAAIDHRATQCCVRRGQAQPGGQQGGQGSSAKRGATRGRGPAQQGGESTASGLSLSPGSPWSGSGGRSARRRHRHPLSASQSAYTLPV